MADALESVLSDNTRRVYETQWKLFDEWCGEMGLHSLPAEPLTVARYLVVRGGDGASVATLRLVSSAIAKAHEWAGHESPCRDPGVRASLRGRGRRLARPQRQAGALTADVLVVIRLTAPKPRARGRGIETPAQAAQRARFDLALVAVLSDGGVAALRGGGADLGATCSAGTTAAAASPWSAPRPTWRPRAAVVAITPAAMRALDAIRPMGVGGEVKVFGLSESQIARRVKVIAKAAGLADWEFFSGHSGRAWPGGWPRTARPPTRSNARAAGSRAAAWSVATPAANPPDWPCATFRWGGFCNWTADALVCWALYS